jgi:hypothetical protein
MLARERESVSPPRTESDASERVTLAPVPLVSKGFRVSSSHLGDLGPSHFAQQVELTDLKRLENSPSILNSAVVLPSRDFKFESENRRF